MDKANTSVRLDGRDEGVHMDSRRRAGFTLTELLTVVGIIALLAAMLFPSFMKVTELARETACQNNLSLVGKAVMQYIQESDDLLPKNHTDAQWGEVASRFPPLEPGQRLPGNDSTQQWWCNKVYRFGVRRPEVYICPSVPERMGTAGPVQCGYGFNDTLTDPNVDGGDGVETIFQVNRPRRTVLVGHVPRDEEEPAISEEMVSVDNWPEPHVPQYDSEAKAVLGRGLFVVADGTLRTYTYSDIVELEDPDNDGRYLPFHK